MKLWKKPVVVVHSMQDVDRYIKANAWTCILRFGRTI